MSALGYVLPGPSWLWRVGFYALLVLSIFGFGWFKGSAHWHNVLLEERAAALKEGVRIATVRGAVTTKVETKYITKIEKAGVITETITQQVPIYVPPTDPDLSAGFRELHDAAATGRLPRPAAISDGAAVPAQDAASIVAANYGICRKDQLKLEELQQWVLEQQKVR